MAVTKTLKDNQTGKTYSITFENDPTEQDLNEAMEHIQSQVAQEDAQAESMAGSAPTPSTEPPQEEPGMFTKFGQGLMSDLKSRASGLMENAARNDQGHGIGDLFLPGGKTAQYALQQTGEVAGAIGDIAKRGTGLAIDAFKENHPTLAKIGAGIGRAFGESPVGQGLSLTGKGLAEAGSDVMSGIEKRSPNAAEDLRALGNIATVAPVGKALGAPLKGLGVRIEESILGKGNKALLKKEGLTPEQAATTALEEAGGTLRGTISKINDKFEKVESQIDEKIQEAMQKTPNKKIDTDDMWLKTYQRISQGDPLFYGQTEAALKELDGWADEFARFKQEGPQTIGRAQEIKRMLGGKGFAKGAVPTSDLQVKEKVADLLNLAFKDELEKSVDGIKELNQVYKRLIPIKEMALNRLPTAQSNDMIGLGSLAAAAPAVVSGDVRALAIPAGYIASKSGRVAQGLYNAGKTLQKYPYPLTITAPASAADDRLSEDVVNRKYGR